MKHATSTSDLSAAIPASKMYRSCTNAAGRDGLALDQDQVHFVPHVAHSLYRMDYDIYQVIGCDKYFCF
jgi:hypothetical protein